MLCWTACPVTQPFLDPVIVTGDGTTGEAMWGVWCGARCLRSGLVGCLGRRVREERTDGRTDQAVRRVRVGQRRGSALPGGTVLKLDRRTAERLGLEKSPESAPAKPRTEADGDKKRRAPGLCSEPAGN